MGAYLLLLREYTRAKLRIYMRTGALDSIHCIGSLCRSGKRPVIIDNEMLFSLVIAGKCSSNRNVLRKCVPILGGWVFSVYLTWRVRRRALVLVVHFPRLYGVQLQWPPYSYL